MTLLSDRVLGRLRYASDVEPDGMWHGQLVRSPHPHARIDEIDVSAVPPGAVVLKADDVVDLSPTYGPWLEDQPIVAADRTRHVGDIVAAVAAPTLAEAVAAAELVRVEYTPLRAVFDPVEAARPGAPLVHEQMQVSDNYSNFYDLRPGRMSNVAHRFRLRSGRGAEGFDEADVVVEDYFTAAGANHVPLEPHAAAAWWDDRHLTVISGTQTPFNNREVLAKLFGLSPEQVTVRVAPMGGSFGSKTFVRLEPVVAALARKIGVPVRLVSSREEVFVTLNRHPAVLHVRAGATRDGRLVAKQIRAWWDTGAYADSGPGVAEKGGYAAIGPYRIPHVAVDSLCVYTHLPPNGAFRGYAATQAVWAGEQIMDTLADRLGMDPLELRLRNILEDGDTFATGEVMHNVRFRECLQNCAEAIGWQEGRAGKGLAVVLKGMTTPSRAEAVLEIGADGMIVLRSATTDMGQRPEETQTRLAAAALGLSIGRVEPGLNSTDETPFDMRTTSSRSTHMMAEAIADAAGALRREIADKLACEAGDLELTDDEILAGADRVPWADLAGLRGHGVHSIEGGLDPDTGQGIASAEWHQGAAGVVVDVDNETGVVSVRHLHTSAYAGRIIDQAGAELQTEGSMILGIGSALLEELDFDEGQLRNANMSDYSIPSSADLPTMTYDLIEDPASPPHGLGETAVPPVPAAIGNALRALDVTVKRMPITPESVLLGIGGARHEEASWS